MKKQTEFKVRVLLFQEETQKCKLWVAQCLEYDIAAQGKTLNAVMSSFERTFMGQILLDTQNGRKPLQGIDKAPRYYFDRFNDALSLKEKRSLKVPRGILPHPVPTARLDERIYAYA